ncbi:unnamed protein product [Polarella glacialis]|uniref:Uncharacterized protein n=1 Tax=Polarella glacialis TaxID=89957 RepID=A0A813EGE1_POLGL|nr:unnamed protein product [Polarella glacialis]
MTLEAGRRGQVLVAWLILQQAFHAGSEEFCDSAWASGVAKSRSLLHPSALDGSWWLKQCSVEGQQPATHFDEGVLTILPGRATLRPVQNTSRSLWEKNNNTNDNNNSNNTNNMREVTDVVWIHDLSSCVVADAEGNCSGLLSAATGLRYARLHDKSHWHLPLNLSAFLGCCLR